MGCTHCCTHCASIVRPLLGLLCACCCISLTPFIVSIVHASVVALSCAHCCTCHCAHRGLLHPLYACCCTCCCIHCCSHHYIHHMPVVACHPDHLYLADSQMDLPNIELSAAWPHDCHGSLIYFWLPVMCTQVTCTVTCFITWSVT